MLTKHYTVHSFPVIAQKMYFETLIPQILPTLKRRRHSNIALITKMLLRCFRKNGIVSIVLQRKTRMKKPKGEMKFLQSTQLQTRPEKGQRAKLNFLGQLTWKFSEVWPKKAKLANLLRPRRGLLVGSQALLFWRIFKHIAKPNI